MNPLDILIGIPGPLFLFYFIIYSVICIVAGRWLAFMDGTDKYPLPDFNALDHIELSLMRGGRAAAIQAAVFELWQKNILEFTEESGRKIICTESTSKPSPSMQAVIHGFFRNGQGIADFFKSRESMEAIDVYLEGSHMKLEMMGLMLAPKDRFRIILVFSVTFLLVLGVGLSKLYFGLKYGRPVAFLMVLMFIAFIAMMIAFRPFKRRRLSRLGIRYLDSVRSHFAWLRQAVAKGDEIPSFNAALFGLAVFGVSFLTGMEMFSQFSNAFPTDFTGDSGTGSTGGCSGFSDGDGGGCSGGGCGGCGGGGD